MSVYKEGSISKWTNYYLGWQPRWFVLDNGVLSYYLSSQEVNQGSRGSVNVASCNIKAHYKDQKRIDIVIKGERYMYLRTSSPSERQKWLIALGSAKQGDSSSPSGPVSESAVIKSKIMILHSNCQLLASQIAILKSVVSDKDSINETTLDELSTKISTSCDEFLNVLAECMDLNYDEGAWPSNLKPLTSVAAASPHISLSPPRNIASTSSNGFFFSTDETSLPSTPTVPRPLSRPLSPPSLPVHLQHPHSSRQSSASPSKDETDSAEVGVPKSDTQDSILQSEKTHSRSNSELFLTPVSSPANTPPPSLKPTPPPSPKPSSKFNTRYCETFFSKLPHKFSDVKLAPYENGIPCQPFLNCCQSAVPFFDVLSPTAFSPVKQDICGNIEKLNRKYASDPEKYHTLQSMVLKELEEGTHNARNSATDALLWLKRAMEFIQVFLLEVANGERKLNVAASTAYGHSLSQYHNWIVKGIFNLAVKAVPYYNDFLKLLGSDGSTTGNATVIEDMKGFSLALRGMIQILNQFYLLHKLDS